MLEAVEVKELPSPSDEEAPSVAKKLLPAPAEEEGFQLEEVDQMVGCANRRNESIPEEL